MDNDLHQDTIASSYWPVYLVEICHHSLMILMMVDGNWILILASISVSDRSSGMVDGWLGKEA